VIEVNELQKRRVIAKLARRLGSLAGTRIGLLGLAFKPHTDDMRGSVVARARQPARGRGCDRARVRSGRERGGAADHARARLRESLDRVVADADAIVARHRVARVPRARLAGGRGGEWPATSVIDGRNALDADAVRAAGLVYEGVGVG